MEEPTGAASAGRPGWGSLGNREAEDGSVTCFPKDSHFFHCAGREKQEGSGDLLAVLNVRSRHCALLLVTSCRVVACEQ